MKCYCHHISEPLLNSHYSVCPKPCKTLRTTASKQLSPGFKERRYMLRNLVLNFGPIVRVQKSIRKMTMLNVINDIGSSMGLWLGLSTYSIFKMLQSASSAWGNKKVATFNQHHGHLYNQHHVDLLTNVAACIICLGHWEDGSCSQSAICHSCNPRLICTWRSFHLYFFGCVKKWH